MSKFRKYYQLREAAAATLPIESPTDAAMAHDDYEDRGVDGFHRLIQLLSRMLKAIEKDLERARNWVQEWAPPIEPHYPDHDDGTYWDDDAWPSQDDFADYARKSQEYQDRKTPSYWTSGGCLGRAHDAWQEFSSSCYYLRDVIAYGNVALQKSDQQDIQWEKRKASEYLQRIMDAAKAFTQAIKQECTGDEETSRQYVLKGPLPVVVNSVVEWILRGRLLELARS